MKRAHTGQLNGETLRVPNPFFPIIKLHLPCGWGLKIQFEKKGGIVSFETVIKDSTSRLLPWELRLLSSKARQGRQRERPPPKPGPSRQKDWSSESLMQKARVKLRTRAPRNSTREPRARACRKLTREPEQGAEKK